MLSIYPHISRNSFSLRIMWSWKERCQILNPILLFTNLLSVDINAGIRAFVGDGVPYNCFFRFIIYYFGQIMYPVFGTKRYKIQTVRRIIIILQPVQFSVMFFHTVRYQNPPPSARRFLSVAAESCEMYTLSLPSFIVTMKLFGIS